MTYIFTILLLSVIIIILIILGKPVNIDYKTDKLLDSFEETDYDKDGRIKRDYLGWNFKDYPIKVNYQVLYKWEKNPFNWKNKVSVRLENVCLPEGFQILLKKNNNDFYEYHSNYELVLLTGGEFWIIIEQLDNHINLSQPQLMKFDIHVLVTSTNIRKTIDYEFIIGEDLDDLWVAFDPGVTGTTVAFGNDNYNIAILKNKKGNQITPSVLVFDKKNIENSFYGEDAESRIGKTDNYTGFRSIKKLLGYKDKNEEVNKDGKELAAKLVKDIFRDIVLFEENKALGIERAKRTVVAIPNNYTATKIKDMLFCIGSLNRFKEIRFIHEAEAILFYYLSNKSNLHKQFGCTSSKEDETILVFDMGGATINATVVQINKSDKDTYEVTILSKIGYGIGGDSIDYCILKSIFDFSPEIIDLQLINIFDKSIKEKSSERECKSAKEKLIELSFKIKKEITKNKNKNELISAIDLQIFLSEAIGNDVYIDVEGDFYRIFKTKSTFCILKNKYFNHLIYDNISDATHEVLKNGGNPRIDKIILAGRSTSFPNIESSINNAFSYLVDIINLNKIGVAKTAVAEGACWYGVNNACIKLNNLKVSANFGFVKTKSTDKEDVQFVNLIGAGKSFKNKDQEQIKSIEKTIDFRDRFNFDGNKVNFYQIMGSDTEKIIAERQRHKYSKIATIKLSQESEKIGMRINENDDVNCSVKLVSGAIRKERGVIADQEITDANEEHYTWIFN